MKSSIANFKSSKNCYCNLFLLLSGNMLPLLGRNKYLFRILQKLECLLIGTCVIIFLVFHFINSNENTTLLCSESGIGFIFGIIIMFSYRPCRAEPGKVRYQIPSRFLSSAGRKGINSTGNFLVRIYVEPLHNFHHC